MRTISLSLIVAVSTAALLLAGGCNEAEETYMPTGSTVTGHFINRYVIPDSIAIQNDYFDMDSSITVNFKGYDLTHQYKDSALFRTVSESLGDTSYTLPTTPDYEWAVAGTVYSVDIVCDKDFSGIAAGESLSSIIAFRALSAYPFIKSGYSDFYDTPWKYYENPRLYPIEIIGDNISPDGLKALYPTFQMYFTEIPDGIGDCLFTVTVDIDGKTLRNSISLSF